MLDGSRFNITVVIATSNNREDLLFHRSLPSVYRQTYYDGVDIVIVDDNDDDNTAIIEKRVAELRRQKGLSNKLPTRVRRNNRTKGHSGTGAWNSAALFSISEYDANVVKNHFLAFLDDDDEWSPTYLESCALKLSAEESISRVGLIASGINFYDNDVVKRLIPSVTTLTQENVFIKNPHIQGSNLFINLFVFLSIGCFDESMPSTTDRDLMMRYLWYCSVHTDCKTIFIPDCLVNYYYDNQLKRVTNTAHVKAQGLDLFYRKYKPFFSPQSLQESLSRAKTLFGYSINHSDTPATIESEAEVKNKLHASPINLVLGVISYDVARLKVFLDSIYGKRPQASENLQGFSICILTSNELEQDVRELADRYPMKITIQSRERGTIAASRTIIHRVVYEYGQRVFLGRFVSWIIDDDCLPCKDIDYFYHIAKNQNSADALVAGTIGEPPIPFLSTLRVQLVDLLFHICPDDDHHLLESDNYYDYSEVSEALEIPFIAKYDVEKQIELLSHGCIATREVFYNHSHLGTIGEETIRRGGNAVIYNPEMLLVGNYTPLSSQYNRRSDFNWAIINSVLYGRTIKSITLPLKHTRTKQEFNLDKEIEKLKADYRGMLFYRLFNYLCKERAIGNNVSYAEANLFFVQISQRIKTIIFANSIRVQESLREILNKYSKEIDESKELQKVVMAYDSLAQSFLSEDNTLSTALYSSVLKDIETLIKNK